MSSKDERHRFRMSSEIERFNMLGKDFGQEWDDLNLFEVVNQLLKRFLTHSPQKAPLLTARGCRKVGIVHFDALPSGFVLFDKFDVEGMILIFVVRLFVLEHQV